MIVGYVWQILGRGGFCAPPHPWAAPKMSILNRVNRRFSQWVLCMIEKNWYPARIKFHEFWKISLFVQIKLWKSHEIQFSVGIQSMQSRHIWKVLEISFCEFFSFRKFFECGLALYFKTNDLLAKNLQFIENILFPSTS